MAIPNKGNGGSVHTERCVQTPYNDDGTSRATFANEENEPEWVHEGEMYKGEPARQCSSALPTKRYCPGCDEIKTARGQDFTIFCEECGSPLEPVRCTNMAVPGKTTCPGHGGNFELRPKHKAALMRANLKTGANFNQILYCPCNMFGNNCQYKEMHFDNDGVARCLPEKMMFDSVIDHFVKTYDLDEVADMIILQRLAMTILRIMRNEKLVAARGEIVERVRTSPDGTTESWFEPNAASTIISKLDSQLLAWLKSLNVTRQSRQNSAAVGDLAKLLSDISISKDQVIDI